MNKDEFLKELAYLLSDLPEEERQEAVDYYRDYIEDSGSEQEVLSQLGNPARVAALIRAGMNGTEQGEYTEHGYEDPRFREPGGAMVQSRQRTRTDSRTYDRRENGESSSCSTSGSKRSGQAPERDRRGLKIALLIILIALASPMLLGLGGGLFGLLMGGFGVLLGLIFGLGGLTFGFLVGGIVSLVMGIIRVCSMASFSGVAVIGGGVALLGAGALCLALCFLFYGRFLPWLFRSIVDLIRGLFRGFRKGGSKE